MRAFRFCLAASAVLAVFSVAAASAQDGSGIPDPWAANRDSYLKGLQGEEEGALKTRRESYIKDMENSPKQWWADWARGVYGPPPHENEYRPYPYAIPPRPGTTDFNYAGMASSGEALPTGPSDANRSTAPIEPVPADKILGQ